MYYNVKNSREGRLRFVKRSPFKASFHANPRSLSVDLV